MTIRDIAQRCGVSVSTVSRVLNSHPDVSEAVRERVLEAVREAHYVPNNSARDLVRPQSDGIGLVVRGIGNLFFSPVIHAVEQAVDAAGYTLVLHQIRSGEDELQAAASLARSKRLRGLVLLGGCFDYTPEDTAAIASVKVKTIPTADGLGVEREIRMADKLKALELLGKHFGMFTDNVRLSGAVGVQIIDDIPAGTD